MAASALACAFTLDRNGRLRVVYAPVKVPYAGMTPTSTANLAKCPVWSRKIRSPQRGSRGDVVNDVSGSLEEFPDFSAFTQLCSSLCVLLLSLSLTLSICLYFVFLRDTHFLCNFQVHRNGCCQGRCLTPCFEFANDKANRAAYAERLLWESKVIERTLLWEIGSTDVLFMSVFQT